MLLSSQPHEENSEEWPRHGELLPAPSCSACGASSYHSDGPLAGLAGALRLDRPAAGAGGELDGESLQRLLLQCLTAWATRGAVPLPAPPARPYPGSPHRCAASSKWGLAAACT